jgi:hypothetical protein
MSKYTVRLIAYEVVTVESDNKEEAVDLAIDKANRYNPDWEVELDENGHEMIEQVPAL